VAYRVGVRVSWLNLLEERGVLTALHLSFSVSTRRRRRRRKRGYPRTGMKLPPCKAVRVRKCVRRPGCPAQTARIGTARGTQPRRIQYPLRRWNYLKPQGDTELTTLGSLATHCNQLLVRWAVALKHRKYFGDCSLVIRRWALGATAGSIPVNRLVHRLKAWARLARHWRCPVN
jgi:hypothetical protein